MDDDDPDNLDELLDRLPGHLRRRVVQHMNAEDDPTPPCDEAEDEPGVDLSWPAPPLPPSPVPLQDWSGYYSDTARAKFAEAIAESNRTTILHRLLAWRRRIK